MWLEAIIHPAALLAFQGAALTGPMATSPRSTEARLFDRAQWAVILVVGLVITAFVTLTYGRSLSGGNEHVRAMAIVLLVTASASTTAVLSRLQTRSAWIVVVLSLAVTFVLVEVPPFLQPEGAHRIREFMMARADEGFASLEEVADAISLYLPHRPRPNSLEGLRRNVRERDGRLYWHWDPAMFRSDRDEAVQRDRLVDPARLGAAAESLRVPTLLVRGGASDVLSPQDAARFLKLVPHSEFAEVSGAHHMVAGDDNVAFESVLGDFLDRRVRTRLDFIAAYS